MIPLNVYHVVIGALIGFLLARITLRWIRHRAIKGALILTVGPFKHKFYNITEENNMALILNADQKVKLTITPVDSYGNLSVVENLTWESSDPDILTIEPNEELETEVYAVAVGPTGDAQVVVRADARIGDGEVVLTGVVNVTVLPAEAVSLSVAAGEPELK